MYKFTDDELKDILKKMWKMADRLCSSKNIPGEEVVYLLDLNADVVVSLCVKSADLINYYADIIGGAIDKEDDHEKISE